jgi:hypothetical protein
LNGSKYGTTILFQNGRMRFFEAENKQHRMRYRWMFERFGLDWKKIDKEDPGEVDCMNLLAWVQFATYLTTVPNKEYWEKELNGEPKDSLGPPSDLDQDDLLSRNFVAGQVESCAADVENSSEEDSAAEGEEPPMKKIVAAIEEEKRAKKTPQKVTPIAQPTTKALVQIEKNGLRENGLTLSREVMASAPMECNNCYVQDRCKWYEAEASCYFRENGDLKSYQDLMNLLRVNIRAQQNRVAHALYMERLDGGVLDKNLSFEMARLEQSIYGFKEFLMPQQEELQIKAKGGAVSAILAALGPRKRSKNPATV